MVHLAVMDARDSLGEVFEKTNHTHAGETKFGFFFLYEFSYCLLLLSLQIFKGLCSRQR